MKKQVCPLCGGEWSDCGHQYQRTYGTKIDYYCHMCRGKRKPIVEFEVKGQIKGESEECVMPLAPEDGKLTFNFDSSALEQRVADVISKARDSLGIDVITGSTGGTVTIKQPNLVNIKKIADRNILVLGDTHEPFCLPGFREFCYELYIKYGCTHVIHLGDFLDNHYSSYHETDPDGYGGNDELSLVKKRIAKWNKIFPVMDVCLGNHDKMIMRKAMSGGIPSAWIKNFNDVLNVKWNWKPSFLYDNVLYRHGDKMVGSTNVLDGGCSIVQGHAHSVSRIIDKVGHGPYGSVFGMQLGCGIDWESYAMLYTEKKPVIGAGVILDNGRLPIRELMKL
ncbi:MAG: metallophosphoesterase [Desulfobulbaceae bacterium]|nr:metallophosphoesterase [Desulfobulbaceae bacterium]